jgi:hypothetical protein
MSKNKNKLKIQYTIFPDGSKLYPATPEKYWNEYRVRNYAAIGIIILFITLIILNS